MKKFLLIALLNIFIQPLHADPNLSHLSDTYVCSWFEVLRVPQQFIDEAKKRNLKCGEPQVKFKVECDSNSIFTNSRCEKLSPNAYKKGDSFACVTGYYKNKSACTRLPSNAIAFNDRDGYFCEFNYSKSSTQNRCILNKTTNILKEPQLGNDEATKIKKCSYGFYNDKNFTYCLKLPSNAIAFSGSNGYYCRPNYRKSTSQNRCVLKQTQATSSLPVKEFSMEVKENSLGDIWQCSKGHKRVQNTCVEGSIVKGNPELLSLFFNSGKPTIYFWLGLIFSAIALDNIFSLRRKRKEAKVKLAEIKLAEIKLAEIKLAEKAKIKEAVDLANAKLEQEKAKFRTAEIKRKKEEAKAKLAEMKQIADKAIADKVIADKAKAAKAIAAKAIADKAIADKAKVDKAVADKAVADKAIADKAKADKEKIIEAEAKLVNPSIEADFKPLMINENSNKSEIIDYSKKLIGKSLRDIITDIQESGLEDQYYSYRRYFPFKEDKGLLVDIERFIEKDSEKHSIFKNLLDIYGFKIQPGNESINYLKNNKIILKTIPTHPVSNQKNNIITNDLPLSRVDYYEIIDEIWENSSLFNEIQNLLLITFHPYPYKKPLDYEIEDVKVCNLLKDLPSYYLNQIQNDWELIRDKVRDGRAHFIKDKQTKYLVTKNDNNKLNNKVRQPNNTTKANSKIFFLKRECISVLFAVDNLVGSPIKNESLNIAEQSAVFTRLYEDGLKKPEKIPKLQPSGRSREYKDYSLLERSKVVKDFLFNGEGHRQLDKKILGLDPKITKGFQSMGILHYLGLKKPFSGIFNNLTIADVSRLLTTDFQNFDLILEHINFPSDVNDESENFNLNHPHYEFHSNFHSLFQNHIGKSEEEMAEFLSMEEPTNKPKNFRRVLVNNLIKAYGQHIEQPNTVLKVIKLDSSGKLTQSIPLRTFKYLDIINEKWETSQLFEQLTQQFIFIVFKEQEVNDSSILQKIISLRMSATDLKEAQNVWKKTVSQINLKKADELPKISESMVLHVRPHAQNKEDTFPTHYGKDVIKKSFWLNAKFIENFIRDYD